MANLASVFMIWISVFGIAINVVVCTTNLDFRAIPSVVKPLETTNFSLQCQVTENTPYYNQQSNSYYYYNNYWQYGYETTPAPTSQKANLAMIRILKNTLNRWEPIVQISNVAPGTVHKLDASITTISGIINDDPTVQSFIQATWEVATSDVFGTYRCDAITFDSYQNGILTTSSQISLGDSLNALDILRVIAYDKKAIVNRLDKQDEVIKTSKNLTEQLKTGLSTLKEETARKYIYFEDKIKQQGVQLQSDINKLGKQITDSVKEITAKILEIDSKLKVVLESGFLMLWPRGTFGLFMPQSGCPLSGITDWKLGWRRHHTESTDRNQDAVSTENHFNQNILERRNGNNFVTQHFCIKTDAQSAGPAWPKGTYCINKKGSCPSLFSTGYVRWTEEGDAELQTWEGELPDGDFANNITTTINYCCRKDGSTDVSVYLPNSYPFYLYRYNGKCQQVYGMQVTQEFIIFDTENTGNIDMFGDVHPDGNINNIRLELCYYKPK